MEDKLKETMTKEEVARLFAKLVVRGCFRGVESRPGRNYEIAKKSFKEEVGLEYEECVDCMEGL